MPHHDKEYAEEEKIIYTVDVNYQVFIRKNANRNSTQEIQSTHQIRYLFYPEIKPFLNKSELKLVDSWEWIKRCDHNLVHRDFNS
jgi:sugar lactone lactonase YvrE